MNKKVLTLSAVMASMLFGAAAHAADTRIGVTIYKYDDNFMSVVRKAIEKDAKAAPCWMATVQRQLLRQPRRRRSWRTGRQW